MKWLEPDSQNLIHTLWPLLSFGAADQHLLWASGKGAKASQNSLEASCIDWGTRHVEATKGKHYWAAFCNMASYKCQEDSLLTADSRRHKLRHERLFVHWADGNVWPLCGFLLAVWTGITLVFVASSINVSQSCPLNKAKILDSILTVWAYHSKWFYT